MFNLEYDCLSVYPYKGENIQEVLCQLNAELEELKKNGQVFPKEEYDKKIEDLENEITRVETELTKSILDAKKQAKIDSLFVKHRFDVITQGFVTAGFKSKHNMQSICYIPKDDSIVCFFVDKSKNDKGIAIKYDSTLKEIARKEKLLVGHANDATYNPKTNKIIVAPSDNHLYIYNADTLEYEKSITIDCVVRTNGICYNPKEDVYYLLATKSDDYRNLFALDSDFNIIPDTEKRYTIEGNYVQGMEYYEDFIVVLFTNWLAIVDKEFNQVHKIPLYAEKAGGSIGAEQEGLVHIGGGNFLTGLLCFNSDTMYGDADLYSDVEAGRIAMFNINQESAPSSLGKYYNKFAYNQDQTTPKRKYEEIGYNIALEPTGGTGMWATTESRTTIAYAEPYMYKMPNIKFTTHIDPVKKELHVRSNLDYLCSRKIQQRFFIDNVTVTPRATDKVQKFIPYASYWVTSGVVIKFYDPETKDFVNPALIEETQSSIQVNLKLIVRTI